MHRIIQLIHLVQIGPNLASSKAKGTSSVRALTCEKEVSGEMLATLGCHISLAPIHLENAVKMEKPAYLCSVQFLSLLIS